MLRWDKNFDNANQDNLIYSQLYFQLYSQRAIMPKVENKRKNGGTQYV